MARNVSDARKIGNVVGLGLMGLGLILFLSVFVTGAMNFGNFDNFTSRAQGEALRAVVGMIFMIAGGAIKVVSMSGLAGSGVLLDPEKAKEELEPFARLSGGLTKIQMEEAGIPLEKVGKLIDRLGTGGADAGGGQPAGGAVQQVIMIRCQNCGKLNEEDSKFCQECGGKL